MTELLTEWAINISHPFLEYYDAQFLELDTLKYPTGVASTVVNVTPDPSDEHEWTTVTDRKRNNTSTANHAKTTPTNTGEILRQSSPSSDNTMQTHAGNHENTDSPTATATTEQARNNNNRPDQSSVKESESENTTNKRHDRNSNANNTKATTPTKTGGILRQQARNKKDTRGKQANARVTTNAAPSAQSDDTPSTQSPDMIPVQETEVEDEEMDTEETSSNAGKSTTSQTNRTAPPLEEVLPQHERTATNDGTHRITVKWKPPSDIGEFEHDKRRLNEALYTLLITMFADTDGVFYRWESEELLETKAASSLTESTVREFVSPTVTFLKSRSLIIFGVRFGFMSNPSTWQYSKETKKTLKEQEINVLISNSKTTSGTVVTAGYILLKAPNTTQRNFYTEYLRSKLPQATPYFDIVRFKKTPMDQMIPHLAVQCGEKHVTPLCKSLIAILNGIESALFLPRYAFQTMPSEQIKRHFDVHQQWCQSLKHITLSPVISHLDQQRVEYYEDGTIIKRSAREWALSLKLEDGKPMHSDVVNGGSDRKTIFICPHHCFKRASTEWQNYRSRLNPPSHREARYVDSVAGLPDLSNIRIEIETNVSLLDQLSFAEIWKNAPATVREGSNKSQGKSKRTTNPNKTQHQSKSTMNVTDNESVLSTSDDSMDETNTNASGNITTNATETRSTASTTATSTAPPTNSTTRFQDLERRIQRNQKQSDAEGQATAAKLSGIQHQFAAMEETMATLQTNQQQLAADLSQMRDNSNQNFTEIRTNMLSSMEATTNVSQSMLDIRTQFSTMSQFMAELAQKMEAILHRCEGIPPEVNCNSPARNHHTGSESSSCLGDPSQTGKSDASKSASQVSSIGKRTLAATQGSSATRHAAQNINRPSPIKKKHRVRNITDYFRTDNTDEEPDEDNNVPANLHSRFQEQGDTLMDDTASNNTERDEIASPTPTAHEPTDTTTSNNGESTSPSQGDSAPPRPVNTTIKTSRLGHRHHDVV